MKSAATWFTPVARRSFTPLEFGFFVFWVCDALAEVARRAAGAGASVAVRHHQRLCCATQEIDFANVHVPIADQQLSIEAFDAHPSSAQRFTDEPLPSGFGDRAVHIYAPHVAPAGIPTPAAAPDSCAGSPGSVRRRHPKLGCRFCVKEKAGLLVGSVGADAHAVEGAVHERKGNDEEDGRHDVRQGAALRSG